jgi:hypothetical protein
MRFSEFAPLNEASYSPGQFVVPGVTQAPPPPVAPTSSLNAPSAPKKPGFIDRNITPSGRMMSKAIKIFKDKFVKQLKFNEKVAQSHGAEFNLSGFVDGYLKTNRWNADRYRMQLDKAIKSGPGLMRNYDELATVMATIGQANTQAFSPDGSTEVAGSSAAHAPVSSIRQY